MSYAPTRGRKVYHKDPAKNARYGAGTVVGFRTRRPNARRATAKSVLVRWSKLEVLTNGQGNEPWTWEDPADLRVTRPRFGKEKRPKQQPQ